MYSIMKIKKYNMRFLSVPIPTLNQFTRNFLSREKIIITKCTNKQKMPTFPTKRFKVVKYFAIVYLLVQYIQYQPTLLDKFHQPTLLDKSHWTGPC